MVKCACGKFEVTNKGPVQREPGGACWHSSTACGASAATLTRKFNEVASYMAPVDRAAVHYRLAPAQAPAPIDLQRMAYESRASSDHAASKAHAERDYWADEIDPDDV